MPLHVPQAPAPALRSVLAALRSPTAVQGAHLPAVARAAQGVLSPELPLAVHELEGSPGHAPAGPPVPPGTASAHRAPAAPRTRLTGWRFLLREADAPPGSPAVGSAEAMLTADGWAFSDFREGPYVTSTERALHQAETLSGVHQPRLLCVPGLYMLTLWLHQDVAADPAEGSPVPGDLLIPLAPAPPGIAAHRPHELDALLPLLTRRRVPSSAALTTPV
ncbi:hypothetical protein [Streptomyces sp. HNM0574]|uniref:hypothetical protein n=1 Tax=Streptomyces sp. HNM0574 TaxID=2714954 RepID=UPI00146C67C7|nr:hypothetical protein [Streptomyces sp. HNM0574]NLU69951.1 hypothetical protein [Streptomyces sp. HNM0574]